ncbi:hypothetical protein K8I28_13045 [bacterium]|nr:hypothetical protein [bacterium]
MSQSSGFYTYTFRTGWNLISFPVLPSEPYIPTVFHDKLTPGDSLENSDAIMTFDPEVGEWQWAWLSEEFGWQGDLVEQELKRELGYWVFIPEIHSDSQSVTIYGLAEDSQNINRGTFEAGVHLIGSVWAGDLPLDDTGLEVAGLRASDGLFSSTPHIEPSSFEYVLGYDSKTGWYTLAWHDGRQWFGDFKQLSAGNGYLLYLSNELHWTHFPRPDQVDQGINLNKKSAVSMKQTVKKAIGEHKAPLSPPLPEEVKNLKDNNNTDMEEANK